MPAIFNAALWILAFSQARLPSERKYIDHSSHVVKYKQKGSKTPCQGYKTVAGRKCIFVYAAVTSLCAGHEVLWAEMRSTRIWVLIFKTKKAADADFSERSRYEAFAAL